MARATAPVLVKDLERDLVPDLVLAPDRDLDLVPTALDPDRALGLDPDPAMVLALATVLDLMAPDPMDMATLPTAITCPTATTPILRPRSRGLSMGRSCRWRSRSGATGHPG